MKTYEIELKRESYITLTIEADSEDQAESIAWEELERNYPHVNDSTWLVESIEEVNK